jgi:hypothetical protein
LPDFFVVGLAFFQMPVSHTHPRAPAVLIDELDVWLAVGRLGNNHLGFDRWRLR